MPRPIRALSLSAPLLLLAALRAAPLRAQDSTMVGPYRPRGAAVGVSVGQMFLGDGGLLTLSLHATDVSTGGIGVDFAAEVSPRLFMEGILAGIADLGVAYAWMSDPGVIVLPHAGVSVLGGFGEAGADGVLGLQAGAGMLIRQGRRSGVRLDLAARQFSELRAPIYSVGIGISGFPGGE